MIEDCKFYYPITEELLPYGVATDPYWGAGEFKYLNASPWHVIGPEGTVKVDTINPYVGHHTPEIQLPGNGTAAGIIQDELAVVNGKKYIGKIILAGNNEALPIMVRLVLDNGEVLNQQIENINSTFQSFPLEFEAPESSNTIKIEFISSGKGKFRIGTISLMPADNIKGWRKDVVALLKELNSPIYRWPGGNFVSGYKWQDCIWKRDKRPPQKIRPGKVWNIMMLVSMNIWN